MKLLLFYPDGTNREMEVDSYDITVGTVPGYDIVISLSNSEEQKKESVFDPLPTPSKNGVVLTDFTEPLSSNKDLNSLFQQLRLSKGIKISKTKQYAKKNVVKLTVPINHKFDLAFEELVNKELEVGKLLIIVSEPTIVCKDNNISLEEEVVSGYQPKV